MLFSFYKQFINNLLIVFNMEINKIHHGDCIKVLKTLPDESFDLVFWLASGETLNVRSSSTAARIEGSIRQVADSTGTLVQPSGYPL